MNTHLKHKLPKLTQEEIDNLNRPLINKDIKTTIRKLPAKKSQGPDDFTAEFYQIVKEELMPIIHK